MSEGETASDDDKEESGTTTLNRAARRREEAAAKKTSDGRPKVTPHSAAALFTAIAHSSFLGAQVTMQALGGVRAKPGQRPEEPNLIEVLADASLIGNEVPLLPPRRTSCPCMRASAAPILTKRMLGTRSTAPGSSAMACLSRMHAR